METPKNSSEKKRQFIFHDWKLYKDEIWSLLMGKSMDEYETEKFDKMKSKLLWLVELMDNIKEKLEKLDSLWVEFLDKDFSFGEIYNKWFKWVERQNVSYYDLHNKLYSLDQKLDQALEAYNNSDEK